ncbi:MAG: putative toxin-antitoxin system toxin component, PIN family [Rubrobacteraceae bacterium]
MTEEEPGIVPRVVFDTNVLVAAYNWPGGMADRAYWLVRRGAVELHTSRFILGEAERILREKFGWEDDRVERAVAQIQRVSASVHEPAEWVDVIENDPTDNRILECALEADVEFLVTGDKKHLLPLGSFRGVSIIGLRDFVVMLTEED